MKRILFVITKTDVGGAQKFVHDQIHILAETFECYLASNQEGWLTNSLKKQLKDKFINCQIEKASLTYLFQLKNFILKNKIDLVVCNSANGGFYGRLAAFLSGVKSIYVSHGWSSIYNGGRIAFIYNFIERILGNIGTSVLCISKNDFEIAQTKIKIPRDKLNQINNAILPFKDSLSVKKSKSSNDDFYQLVTIARLAKPKKVDILIKAVSTIPNIKLTVIGDGPLKNDLMELSNSMGLKNVCFIGEIESFANFDHYDIFALISESEGLPMSAIESMSFGLPLILSNVGGCPELINNSGVLVENHEASIKAGILECISQIPIFSKNAYAQYNEEFNLLNKKEIFIKYYLSIIER